MSEFMPECPKCKIPGLKKERNKSQQYQRYICKKCGFLFTQEAIDFAKRIYAIRVILNLTQEELAIYLGITHQRVCLWENCYTSLPRQNLRKRIEYMERQIEETGTVPKINKRRRRIGPKFYDNGISPGNITKI